MWPVPSMASTNKTEVDQAEVVSLGHRVAALQKRKMKVNAELSTLDKRVALLRAEAEDLAKEHLSLLRKFDSVAKLP